MLTAPKARVRESGLAGKSQEPIFAHLALWCYQQHIGAPAGQISVVQQPIVDARAKK